MGNILIVDDDRQIRETLVHFLERMGHETIAVGTAGECLQAIAEETFDVLFLDVRLPDGNGLDILPRVKSRPGAPEVIIITGEGDPDGEACVYDGYWRCGCEWDGDCIEPDMICDQQYHFCDIY